MQKRLVIAIITVSYLCSLAWVTHLMAGQKKGRSKAKVRAVADDWYLFRGPDGDFTLAFPRKPSREQDEQGPRTIIRMYGVTMETGMRFSVNLQDLGGDPHARSNNEWGAELDEMSTAAARQRGERVVQIHHPSKNVVETVLIPVIVSSDSGAS